MLTHLYVRNFAVVEEAEIDFSAGLTVVTGETGAGKSLLVDALMLLSGTRADSTLVRSGQKRAELSAAFDLMGLPAALEWLREQDLDEDDGCQLRRVLKAEGSSRAWINGRPATLAQLSELASMLVEIHGQHEHQSLLSRHHQLDLLDAFAENGKQRDSVRELAREWRRIATRIRDLSGGEDRQSRIELLQHELTQLQQWAVPAAELADLEATHRRMANADRLLEGCNAVLELLDGDSDFAVRRALARSQAELSRLIDLDDGLASQGELLANAEIQLAEAVDAINHYAENLQPEPERLADLDTHLSQLHALSRRHRLPIDELPEKQTELARELDELQGAGATLEELAAERETCLKRYQAAASELSDTRHKAATTLGRSITQLMQELGMAGGRFEIRLIEQEGEQPDSLGQERCEFMVSANPGQDLRPLRKVASGGELSRISLAIKVAALDGDNAASMVFDEVDSGIGGAVAEVVGQKLRKLGAGCQVLCVTHLPQVAAQAHAHLKVSKSSSKSRTRTGVELLDDKARRDEVARMLGGIEITRETEAHAQQMINRAQAG
ncbi:MAG: DNA repair protein RecN [Rhodanobacteraceae bacterium]